MEKKILTIIRCSYGKQSVLPQDRDYKIENTINCPAGNLTDWQTYAKEQNYTALRVNDPIMAEDYIIEL